MNELLNFLPFLQMYPIKIVTSKWMKQWLSSNYLQYIFRSNEVLIWNILIFNTWHLIKYNGLKDAMFFQYVFHIIKIIGSFHIWFFFIQVVIYMTVHETHDMSKKKVRTYYPTFVSSWVLENKKLPGTQNEIIWIVL